MGELRVMGQKGDVKVEWNPENEDEVAIARKVFQENRRKGFKAFEMSGRGTKGEQLDEFDPDAKRIIFIPPMKGG